MNNQGLNKKCKGCNKQFFNDRNFKPSQFFSKKYCSNSCRISNSNFARNCKNYTGQTINNIEILSKHRNKEDGLTIYKCKCYCGQVFKTRISRILNNITKSCGCYRRKIASHQASMKRGNKHWNWNENLTYEDRIQNRDIKEAQDLRKKVFERDNYTCQICLNKRKLNAHHLDGWNWCKEKRFDPDNCVTLCEKCHNNFHKEYGKGNNTKEQFIAFAKGK